MNPVPTDSPAHPGIVLERQFLEPLGMTQTDLANRLEVPYQRVNQIINRRRAVTPDTALRLARLFGTSPDFWLDLQLRWDLHEATETAEIDRIRPIARAKAGRTVVREGSAAPATPDILGQPDILNQIVERLVEAIDPEKIILFGSSATKVASPGSDIDLLVVDRETFGSHRSRRQQLQRARRALAGLAVAKDILLYSADEFDRWRRSPNHVIGRAFRQGRVLYERS